MKTKYLLEQRDKYNQRLTLDVEQPNGEPLDLNKYVRGLVATQSLQAWNGDPDGLRDWITGCVTDYLKQSRVHIWGHGI